MPTATIKDSKWIPYGWYWDSGGVFNSYHGIIRIENSLKTESIPIEIINRTLAIRIIGIAYSSDLNKGVITEYLLKYPMSP